MSRLRLLAAILFTVVLAGSSVGLVACGDDDDDGGGVEVINQTPDAEPDPEPDPEADPEPDPEADPEPDPEADPEPDPEADPVAEVTPAPKPAEASQIDVTLSEWEIVTSAPSVTAGEVYFLVQNAGPEDAHEFVVIKSDLPGDGLPVEDGRVPEDEVDLLDEIEPFPVGATASLTLDLEPGAYVLICNIAEEEDGAIESHYELGMRTAFTVE